MQEIIDLIARYGYIILFVYSLGGGFIALVGASVLSYIGKMDLPLTLFVAATANFLGDVILFCLARYQKQSVKPYLVGHRRKIALIHLLMKRHGFIILIVKKYIYGFRTLVPIVAAFVNYPLDRFMLYNCLL
ncbi:MAG: VTT domain-containing protein [Helicobacter sp.]|nr:VTT domain-containing protein [Helicobacter sp.]